jgi:hypothetical protein
MTNDNDHLQEGETPPPEIDPAARPAGSEASPHQEGGPEAASPADDKAAASVETASPMETVAPASIPPVLLDEPDALVLAQEIFGIIAVPPPGTDYDAEVGGLLAALAAYKAIDPKDGLDSLLARVAVATSKAAMDSSARLAKAGDVPEIRKLYFKQTMEASMTLTKVTEAIDRHRRLQQPRKSIQQIVFKK